jgi:glucosyl-3-phosphoglycerate synthase
VPKGIAGVKADRLPAGSLSLCVPPGVTQDPAKSGVRARQQGVKPDGCAVGSLSVSGPVLPAQEVSLVGVVRGRVHSESKHGAQGNIKSQPFTADNPCRIALSATTRKVATGGSDGLSEADELAEAWSRRRTSRWQDWPAKRLGERKNDLGVTVSVVIPARNEERTVGGVVSAIARLAAGTGLVDELVVMDSDSTDETSAAAATAGATVHRVREVAPHLGGYPGKGEALWKSLLVTKGDVLVFVDADLTHWGPHFVTGLLGPLLDDQGVLLVKGFYERLFKGGDGSVTADGGRVTELVARPLLSLWWPELTGVIQPLAGEWAVRRDLMESLSVPVGYGIELAVLLDTAAAHGLDAVAQVDLGKRGHKHQASHDLAVMAAELLLVADRRRSPHAPPTPPPTPPTPTPSVNLRQFVRADGDMRQRSRPVPVDERPPVNKVTW